MGGAAINHVMQCQHVATVWTAVVQICAVEFALVLENAAVQYVNAKKIAGRVFVALVLNF